MKILITGAGGMLGHDTAAAANAVHHEVAEYTRAQLDITSPNAVLEVFERELPAVVINCAAWTDVDGAESNEIDTYLVNESGAGNVSAAAAAIGARIIHISTDYVFDGSKREPYVESDKVGAIGVYGESKLAGERAVIAANPRHLIVRTSWLFGMNGKNFVDTMLMLAEKQSEIVVVNDQFGCPTYTGDLAVALVELLDYERLGIMHIAGGGVCSWYDFAIEIFRQSQVEVSVLSGSTAMLGRPAPRPVYTALTTEREETPKLPRWDHGLHAYLVQRSAANTQETEALDPNQEIDS
ncbi:MAG: dTDP-4-dehydrorhamnose reductase [Solirubrobacterales bacterium]